MALGSTQPQVKISTRNIPGGKGCRCVRLTTSPLNILEPSGPHRACHGTPLHLITLRRRLLRTSSVSISALKLEVLSFCETWTCVYQSI